MLSTQQAAPPINAVSLYGRSIDLDKLEGKKVLVKFHRFSGCPVARRQVHDLIEEQEALNAAGIETIAVMHSSEEKMRPNFVEVPGLHLIADPKKALYRAYEVQFRWRRLLSLGTWRETLVSFARGYLPQFSNFEGGIVGVPSDFLLDEKGMITATHYGRHFGDSWTAADVLKAAADDGEGSRPDTQYDQHLRRRGYFRALAQPSTLSRRRRRADRVVSTSGEPFKCHE